jgi:hypothetical protein
MKEKYQESGIRNDVLEYVISYVLVVSMQSSNHAGLG